MIEELRMLLLSYSVDANRAKRLGQLERYETLKKVIASLEKIVNSHDDHVFVAKWSDD